MRPGHSSWLLDSISAWWLGLDWLALGYPAIDSRLAPPALLITGNRCCRRRDASP